MDYTCGFGMTAPAFVTQFRTASGALVKYSDLSGAICVMNIYPGVGQPAVVTAATVTLSLASDGSSCNFTWHPPNPNTLAVGYYYGKIIATYPDGTTQEFPAGLSPGNPAGGSFLLFEVEAIH